MRIAPGGGGTAGNRWTDGGDVAGKGKGNLRGREGVKAAFSEDPNHPPPDNTCGKPI